MTETKTQETRDWRTRFISLLWIATVLLLAASAITAVISSLTIATTHGEFWAKVHETLNVGVEFNLPTWFASVLWALFSLAAVYLSTVDLGRRLSWLLVALVGLLASVDEYLMLHDRLGRHSNAIEIALGIDLGGATWILLGVVIAAAVAALLARFVLSLAPRTRRDIVMGAVLFLTGAIGFELISNLAYEVTQSMNWIVELTRHIEELLEFAGVIVATRGLLRMCGQSADQGTPNVPEHWANHRQVSDEGK